MAFENHLGGFAGPIDEMSGINNALAQNAMRAPPPQQKRGRSFGDILGMIGDAISIGAGGQPIYQQRKQRENISGAMQNFMDDPRATVQALLNAGEPEMAIEVMRAIPKPEDNRPGIIKEFDEVNRLPPEQRRQFMGYIRERFPGAMSPIIMGENDRLEMPGQQGGGEMIAEDGNGNRVRFNPQSGAWEPMGGETDSAPSGPFPG